MQYYPFWQNAFLVTLANEESREMGPDSLGQDPFRRRPEHSNKSIRQIYSLSEGAAPRQTSLWPQHWGLANKSVS